MFKPICVRAASFVALSTSVLTQALGCSAESPIGWSPVDDSTVATIQNDELLEDLALGEEGPDVQLVYLYLAHYGYFPNAKIAEHNPLWIPVLDVKPPDPSVFDEVLLEAVFMFQTLNGLPSSGVVDEATRTLMKVPRCPHPDMDPEALSPEAKFALFSHYFGDRDLDWRVGRGSSAISGSAEQAAIQRAFATWEAASDLDFTQITGSSHDHDIDVRFENESTLAVFDGPGGVLGYGPPGNVYLDEDEDWYYGVGAPGASQVDLESVALHEIGHVLGIAHSSVTGAVMWPWTFEGAERRSLNADDRIAVDVHYGRWARQPGGARDIAAGNGHAWVVGTIPTHGGHQIYRRTATGWVNVPGGGEKIAIGGSGAPWLVNSSGAIYRRTGVTSSSPSGSGWERMPGSAKDVDVGENGSAWVIGTLPTVGGNLIYRWTGSTWTNVPGGASRIAVGPDGTAWIVNNMGQIYRRRGVTPGSPSGTSWEILPGTARDIGVGADGTVWLVGTDAETGGYGLYVWNEQVALGGGVNAESRRAWIKIPGGGTGISVADNGRPWMVNSYNDIYERK